MSSSAYLSAVSIMLGSYGFFYGAFQKRMDDGLAVGRRKEDDAGRKKQVAEVETARSAAITLTVVPLLIGLVWLGPVIEEIEAAFDAGWDPGSYSAVDVAFVLVALSWFLIAGLMFKRALKLKGKLGELAAKPAPAASATA